MSEFRETPEFKRGRQGEQLVAAWLQSRGWWIIPSYDYNGGGEEKAPRLQGARKGLVIPDLDISKNRTRLWAEVKTKSAATFYRKLARDEHGIAMRLWEHYHEVQKITGCQVWIFIVEESTKTLLAESLDVLDLEMRESHSESMGAMIFWPRASFKEIANAEAFKVPA